MESSLTSSESSGRKEEEQIPINENIGTRNSNPCVELSLMDIHPENKTFLSGSSNQANGKKRSASNISDGICVEQPLDNARVRLTRVRK
ncbi:hypothetical protein COLO4_22954 [Corchorus olitorius]|uniref:Uncharacterized protein n=1 Tax=Corchorus olitorius TaxID=93759 RepID=A0A1R3IJ20_9ROSI|nr:hypothetical protein COLO4_22954 [Corchorus olitorius]